MAMAVPRTGRVTSESSVGGTIGFCRGFLFSSIIWCAIGGLYLVAMMRHAGHGTASLPSTVGLPRRPLPRTPGTRVTVQLPSPSILPAADLRGSSPQSQQLGPLKEPVDERGLPPVTGTWRRGKRSEYARRFTDMSCYTHGDESELCAFENALCFDGERVVLSVPQPPGPEVGSNEYGHILGDLTTNCYDFRYYESEAVEYNGCRYDSPRFHRIKSKLLSQELLDTPPTTVREQPPGTWGNAFTPDDELEAIFMARDVKTDWPIPLTRRRWGPGNRGSLLMREINGYELFGPKSGEAPRECPGCSPPAPPKLSPSMRVSHVTQYGNTTATWLDGPLWIMAVDAQFATHIYHFSTRILSMFSAQRHNGTYFGENPADGYLLPWNARSHPVELTWHHKEPVRRQPKRAGSGRASGGEGAEPGSVPNVVNAAGFLEEADAPNRVQYMTGSQWMNIPAIDYLAFAGPSSNFPGIEKLLPFLQSMMALSGQPQTYYFGRTESDKLSPNNLVCAKRGAIVGTHNRFFPSRADAWMFRQYAYDYAGLTRAGVNSHDNHPPRKITIITRKRTNGRMFDNQDDLIAAANATGLEVEIVQDLGKLPFKKVVELMGGTGILIAAHGAALVNAMFLPQHAVVIEIFPYLMKKMTYFHLSAISGLFYFPMYTWERPPKTPQNSDLYVWTIATNEHFDQCVERNVSTIDALLQHSCNSVSKLLPIIVDMKAFGETLHNALDVIGAYSPGNVELQRLMKAGSAALRTRCLERWPLAMDSSWSFSD